MKSGAEAGTPCRRSSSTCPISCTKISPTRPTPNHQPPSSAYAPTDTSIDAPTLKIFSFQRTAPNLAMNAPAAAIGAQIRRKMLRQSVPRGWIAPVPYWPCQRSSASRSSGVIGSSMCPR